MLIPTLSRTRPPRVIPSGKLNSRIGLCVMGLFSDATNSATSASAIVSLRIFAMSVSISMRYIWLAAVIFLFTIVPISSFSAIATYAMFSTWATVLRTPRRFAARHARMLFSVLGVSAANPCTSRIPSSINSFVSRASPCMTIMSFVSRISTSWRHRCSLCSMIFIWMLSGLA